MKRKLFVDQHGYSYRVNSIRELRKKIGNGGSRVSKMYADGTDGKTYHVGYVVGKLWLTAYAPVRIPA